LKFRDVLSRWERRELSMLEAGELLGMSERQFRRDRHRFEVDGDSGLSGRRLGRRSPQRIPERELRLMPDLYWDCCPAGQHVWIASTAGGMVQCARAYCAIRSQLSGASP
jgi:hypothetical protein